MKATIELCHQKCRLTQACSHNQVGIYIMGVGGGVDKLKLHTSINGRFSVQCQCGQSRSNNRHLVIGKKARSIFSDLSLCLRIFFPSFSRSLCFVPWSRRCLFSAWPVRRAGLAALCLVSRRSVWYRGALRSLCQCRCECKLVVCPGESLSSRVMGRAPVV